MTSYPLLYSFRRCPYAMRARLALLASDTKVELREILLRDKAPEFLAVSPKGTVPVLVTAGGRVIEESLDIMLWALSASDPEGLSEDLPRLLALVYEMDTGFKPLLDRYKYPQKFGSDPGVSRQEARPFLLGLNEMLEGQDYLFGRLSLADLAIWPFARQFAHVDRAWFWSEKWPDLIRWLDAFLASDEFARIMGKYPKWQAGDPLTLFPPPEPIGSAVPNKDSPKRPLRSV